MSAAAGKCFNTFLSWTGYSSQGIIDYSVPVIACNNKEVQLTPRLVIAAFNTVSKVNLNKPETILQSQIPCFSMVELPTTAGAVEPVDRKNYLQHQDTAAQKDKTAGTALTGPPLVAIYNTHTGETYQLTDGVERLDKKRGGVVRAAEALEERLQQEYGINVVRSNKIHDAQYNMSYIESEKTVKKLVNQYKELKLLLDIHRDAGRAREDSFVTINGDKVAPIMIIVGSDARRPFPKWQQNLAMAKKLADKMDELYPGLSLGVRVKEGRYNQQYHNGALLLEIGSVQNTTEEAVKAAELLADVVAELLKEYK